MSVRHDARPQIPAWKYLMAVSDNDNVILILFCTVFSSIELLIFPLKRGPNFSSVKAEIVTQ